VLAAGLIVILGRALGFIAAGYVLRSMAGSRDPSNDASSRVATLGRTPAAAG
jgi:hypothetical protein